jgi:hypothetical protein
MLKKSFPQAFVAIAASAAMLAPLPTLAATATRQQNQASLNAAMAALANGSPFAADSTINLQARLPSSPVTSGMSGTLKATFNALSRVQPQSNGGIREESNISAKTITFQPTGMSSAIPVDGSLMLKTKVLDGRLFVLVDSAPPTVASALTQAGVDISSMQGKWVAFDQMAAGSLTAPLLSPLESLVQPDLWQRAVSGQPNVFTISKVEKNWTDNGHDLFRARLTLNPSVLAHLKDAEIAKIDAKDTNRKTLVADVRTRYTKLQQMLASMEFVGEIDRTSNSLRRLEIGGVLTQPLMSCTATGKNKMRVCKAASNLKLNLNIGTWFRPDTGPLIAGPVMRHSSYGIAQH